MWPELLSTREGHIAFEKFIGGCSVDGERFYSYTRPAGASMLLLVAIGGGGGGGAGETAATAGGGGGGSSGTISRLIIPWRHLPQTIFISCGNPVAGSTDGIASRVLVAPDTSLATGNHILKANGGNKGSDGSGGGGGGAGAAPTVNANTDGPWQSLGTWVAVAGQVGTAGGNSVNTGGALSFGGAGVVVMGGTGGGGHNDAVSRAGGAVNGVAGITPTISGGPSGGSDGRAGVAQWQTASVWPGWAFCGGTGGGSNHAGTGGIGGNGAIGSGGGGGGAGDIGSAGGMGGPGMVVLVSW